MEPVMISHDSHVLTRIEWLGGAIANLDQSHVPSCVHNSMQLLRSQENANLRSYRVDLGGFFSVKSCMLKS